MKHTKRFSDRRNSRARKMFQNLRQQVAYNKLKRQTTEIPESSPQRIVIPSNDHGTGFMRNSFIPDYLDHLISQQQFLEVIDEVNSLIRRAWTKKRILDNQQFKALPCYILGLFLMLSIIVGIMIAVYVFYSINDLLIYIAFIIGQSGLVLTFLIMVGNVCKKYRKFLSFDAIVYLDLNEYLASINNTPYFVRRGLTWNLQKRRFWLELNIGAQNIQQHGNLSNVDLLADAEVSRESTIKTKNYTRDRGTLEDSHVNTTVNDTSMKRKISRGQVHPIGNSVDQGIYGDESNDYNTIEANIRKSQERVLFDRKKQDSHAQNLVPSDDGQEIEQLFGSQQPQPSHKLTKSEVQNYQSNSSNSPIKHSGGGTGNTGSYDYDGISKSKQGRRTSSLGV